MNSLVADDPDGRRRVAKELWLIEMRLEAFAYLFRGHNGEAAEDSGALIGIADILNEMGERLAEVRAELEKPKHP